MAAKKINYKVKSMNGLLMCTNDCNLRCKYCFEECIHREKMKSIQEIREEFSSFLENDFDVSMVVNHCLLGLIYWKKDFPW